MINPVAEFLALITRKKRYKPSIVWSSALWTHNVFRVWELIVWKPYGIRASVVSWQDENFVSHQIGISFEAKIALVEVFIRSLCKRFLPRVVLVPQMQLLAINARYGYQPYRFAIAFDTSSGQQTNAEAVTNPALSHTCTGSELVLAMWEVGDLVSDNVTSMTYNSVAGTRVQAVQVPTDRWIYAYILAGPSTGANNIVSNGNTFGGKAGTSYTGCSQTGQPDASSGVYQSTASTNATITVTVVASDCWLLGYSYGGGNTGAGAGTTNRGTAVGSGILPCDSNGTVGTGSQSLIQTQGNSAYVALGMSIKPPGAAAGGTVNRGFTLLGVGQ